MSTKSHYPTPGSKSETPQQTIRHRHRSQSCMPKSRAITDLSPEYVAFPWPVLITVAGLEPKLNIQCGPLLRFVYTDLFSNPLQPISLYTLLIVTKDLGSDYSASPFLSVVGIYAEDKEDPSFIASEKIHQERGFTFW